MDQHTDTIRSEKVTPKERLPKKLKKINKEAVFIAQNSWRRNRKEAVAQLLRQIFKWDFVVVRKTALDLTPGSFYSAFAK
jgi:hypothetical protein